MWLREGSWGEACGRMASVMTRCVLDEAGDSGVVLVEWAQACRQICKQYQRCFKRCHWVFYKSILRWVCGYTLFGENVSLLLPFLTRGDKLSWVMAMQRWLWCGDICMLGLRVGTGWWCTTQMYRCLWRCEASCDDWCAGGCMSSLWEQINTLKWDDTLHW